MKRSNALILAVLHEVMQGRRPVVFFILLLLREHGGMGTVDIADAAGFSRQWIHNMLVPLRRQGMVNSESRTITPGHVENRWLITEKGMGFVNRAIESVSKDFQRKVTTYETN